MTADVRQHPDLADLIERSETPDIAAHLATCATCRARHRLLTQDSGAPPPGLEEARKAMARARLTVSRQLSLSVGTLGSLEDGEDDLVPGQQVERYQVEERIGSGGMGTVYRVRHVQLGSQHALKVLHRTSRAVRERLIREGRAQSRLAHPNVVAVTDIVDVEGSPGLVLELVRGPTLSQLLARQEGRLAAATVHGIACDVLRGVAAAHEAGIVHRDLKPANVLLLPTRDGFVAKVSDFGLARVLAGDEADEVGLTGSRAPMGTPAYMAPEQVHDASRADERSDVFALGALLYELISGETAFGAPDVISIYDKVRAGDFVPLDEIAPETDPHWVDVVHRALAVDPADRFADGPELLAAWRAGEGSLQDPGTEEVARSLARATQPRPPMRGDSSPSTPIPAGSSPERPRLLTLGVVAVAAVAVVALGGAIAWITLGNLANVAAGTTPAPVGVLDEPGSALAKAPVERRLTNRPADVQLYALSGSHDGEHFAWTDGRGLWMQRVDGGVPQLLLDGTALHNVAFLQGDHELFVSGWRDGEAGIWTVPVDGSEPTAVDVETGALAEISPDGTTLAFVNGSGLWISQPDGSERRRIRSLAQTDMIAGMAWSPDSRSIATVNQSGNAELGFLEITAADGSTTRRLLEAEGLASMSIAALAWTEPDTLVYVTTAWGEKSRDAESTGPVTDVWAIEDASVPAESLEPVHLHTWEGFFVLRLEPSADGTRFFASRAESRMQTLVVDLEDPAQAAPPGEDGWEEFPVDWTGPHTLAVTSDRAGGGVYAYDLDAGTVKSLYKPDNHPGFLMRDGDEDLVFEYRKDEPALIGRRGDLSTGELRDVFVAPKPDGGHLEGVTASYAVQCGDGRCVMGVGTDERLSLHPIDLQTGEPGEAVFSTAINARRARWDVSPDGTRVAIASTKPARLTVHDLATGITTERHDPIGFAMAVEWDRDGEHLFVAGMTEAQDEPYRLYRIAPDGSAEPLWSALASIPGRLRISPDGKRMALGTNQFDDDIWLVEGLLDPLEEGG